MIEITDQSEVKAKVFRLFSRDGTGSCKRSLWVRFDYTKDGWSARFWRNG